MNQKLEKIVGKFVSIDGPFTENGGNRLSLRNLIMFPLGTIGRDFLYMLFNGYLLTFILFTKELTDAQFGSITFIIIAARIFDALNDPIMGGIVENTRTKWGKYKPWQLIGAVLTGGVVIAVFCAPVGGWGFIGLLAVAYIMFSVTFTMNDISYWGMMPSLTSHPDDRNKLTSFAQLCAGAGSGLVSLTVPMFTAGILSKYLGGGVAAYRILAILAAVLMVAFQLFSILGVKEKQLPPIVNKTDRLTVKKMFKTIFKNDQLMWGALILLIASLGNSIVGGGLLLMYFYFEFGYQGGWYTTFGIGMSITSTLFTFVYPWISQKFGRKKTLYTTFICLIVGYLMMMVFGLALPTGAYLSTGWWVKFVLMTIGYTVAGFGHGFYMILVINIANTVEYNEWKTGNRDESLIFSLRPFTAKLSSALQQGVVTAVYLIAGVLAFTNQISAAEQDANLNPELADKLNDTIMGITSSVPQQNKMILLTCMCVIPVVLFLVCMLIYHKKCILDEATLERMAAEVAERKANESIADGNDAEVVSFDENGELVVIDNESTADEETESCPEELQEVASDVLEEVKDEVSEDVIEEVAENLADELVD